MGKRITIIQGHPAPDGGHFCHALATAYAEAASAAGHQLRRIEVGQLDFPVLRSKADFQTGQPPPAIAAAQAEIAWAEHLVLLFPLWLGAPPALFKGFLEQVFRPGFAFGRNARGLLRPALGGRSARVVVSMGMPALVYRWYFAAHGLKSLNRNILGFCGIKPIRSSVVGSVEAPDPSGRQRWLERMAVLGRNAQ